jgi:hypothetical protein
MDCCKNSSALALIYFKQQLLLEIALANASVSAIKKGRQQQAAARMFSRQRLCIVLWLQRNATSARGRGKYAQVKVRSCKKLLSLKARFHVTEKYLLRSGTHNTTTNLKSS